MLTVQRATAVAVRLMIFLLGLPGNCCVRTASGPTLHCNAQDVASPVMDTTWRSMVSRDTKDVVAAANVVFKLEGQFTTSMDKCTAMMTMPSSFVIAVGDATNTSSMEDLRHWAHRGTETV